jgi:hypothetical protein
LHILGAPGRKPKTTGSSPAIRSAEESALGVSFNAQSQAPDISLTSA